MCRVTLQQTSSPDITTVSNTLYNRTSWTTQHALSSDHLPIITTINIRHDYRLQQNRRTFTNYKKADWTQFTEDTDHHTHQHTHCQHNYNQIHTHKYECSQELHTTIPTQSLCLDKTKQPSTKSRQNNLHSVQTLQNIRAIWT